MKEPRMSENGEIGTIQITCYDGTVIQIPDDNRVTEHLGGRTIEEIYTDSRRLPAECEKFVVFRPPPPPLIKRIADWIRRFRADAAA